MPLTGVVNVGRAVATARMIGVGTAAPTFIAWGTGVVETALTDTTLTEPGEARTSGTATQVTTTTTNDTHRVVGTITATAARSGAGAIGEAGLFTAVTGGTLYVRGVLATPVTLAINDTITFTFNIQVTSALA